MDGHCLRRIFDSAYGGQAIVCAEWVGGVAMCGAPALHANGIPGQHLVKKAHVSLVRDVPLDPSPV
jgi:hypothetical protein